MSQRLAFYCVCGQAGAPPPPDPNGWSSIAAYGNQSCMRWHDSRERAVVVEPPIDCLDHPPEVGGIYWGMVNMPFAAQTADTFWIVYDSPPAYFNGLLSEPTEIASVHLVRCKLLGWERLADKRVITRVQALEVVSIADLERLPPVTLAQNPLGEMMMGQLYQVRHRHWWLLDRSLEGDEGDWFVLHGTDEPTHLLLHGNWGSHSDYVWAGHAALDEGQRARARQLFERAKYYA